MSTNLSEKMGIMLWHIRRTRKKKAKPIAHKAKITVERLEQLEHGLSLGHVTIFARVAAAFKIPLWQLVKDCEEETNEYKLALTHWKLMKARHLT